LEAAWAHIHAECGYQVARQTPVPAWDRWRWHCSSCAASGTAATRPAAGAACSCGAPLAARREEAILDLEIQRADCPRVFLDVTVRYAVPGDAEGLQAAAARDGAVNKGAEADKHARYPAGRAPWRMVPLALETGGRHGPAALRHLRLLARDRAQLLAGDDPAAAAAAAGALTRRWGAELAVALQAATARQLRTALGAGAARPRARAALAAELAA
jgi:hypothetical protein